MWIAAAFCLGRRSVARANYSSAAFASVAANHGFALSKTPSKILVRPSFIRRSLQPRRMASTAGDDAVYDFDYLVIGAGSGVSKELSFRQSSS